MKLHCHAANNCLQYYHVSRFAVTFVYEKSSTYKTECQILIVRSISFKKKNCFLKNISSENRLYMNKNIFLFWYINNISLGIGLRKRVLCMTFFKQITLSFLSRTVVKSINIWICSSIYNTLENGIILINWLSVNENCSNIYFFKSYCISCSQFECYIQLFYSYDPK